MTIEYIGTWDDAYPLYRASWRGIQTYGTTQLQAFKNMLGIVESLKWDNYSKSLN